jgi:predicted ester cyclase
MSALTSEKKALVTAFFDAMNGHELDALDIVLASDVVRHCPATPDVIVTSLAQFKDFMRADASAFPDSCQTPVLMVEEGELVAVWATYEGTQSGPLGPFQPSGMRCKFDFSGVFRVSGTKIVEWWVTWDNLTILRQLGHA